MSINTFMKIILMAISLLALAACGGKSNGSNSTAKTNGLPDQINPATTLSQAEIDTLRSLKLTAAPVEFVMPKAIAQ